MKISIVYFSSTGRTAKMAEEIKKGIAAASADIEVGLFPITELTSYNEEHIAFVNDSAAVIVGTPDYYASEANQLKTWLDTCPCKLADKLCGAYATANFLQGGADVAIQSVLTQLLVKLGVPQEIAEKDACKIEHDLSPESYQALKDHMETLS